MERIDLKLRNKKGVAKSLLAALLCCSVAVPMTAFSHDQEWALPTYDANPLTHIDESITTAYAYKQHKVKGLDTLPVVKKKAASLKTPEQALITRFSAVRSLDYDWWIQTWAPDAWKLAEAKYAAQSLDKKFWLENWKTSYVDKEISVIHKIEFKEYVILTYTFTDKKGDPAALEYPIVFKKIEGEYKVSLDLRAHPLLIASPWVSGNSSEVVNFE